MSGRDPPTEAGSGYAHDGVTTHHPKAALVARQRGRDPHSGKPFGNVGDRKSS